MAGSLVLPSRRLAQPQTAVGLNLANPLTRGLLACWSNGAIADAVSGQRSTFSGTASLTYGLGGVQFTTDSSGGGWTLGTQTYPTATGAFTILVGVTSAAAGQQLYLTNNGGINIYTFGTGAIGFDKRNNTAITSTANGALSSQPGVSWIVVSYDGTNAKIYVNGVLKASSSNAQTLTAMTWGLGAFGTTNALMPAYWDRVLSDAEVAAIGGNPYQLLAPQRKFISNIYYSVAPADPISTLPNRPGFLVLPRRRFLQPQESLPLLSNGIRAGLIDLITPSSSLSKSGTVKQTGSVAGMGIGGDGSASYYYRNSSPAGFDMVNGFTMLAVVCGAAAVDDTRVYAYGLSTSNNPILAIGSGIAASNKLRIWARDNSNNAPGTGNSVATVFENGIPHVALLRWNPVSTTLDVYVDGKQESASNFSFGSGTFDRTGVGALYRAAPASFCTSNLLLGALWNRALSDAEAASISRLPNAWSLLPPNNQSIPFTGYTKKAPWTPAQSRRLGTSTGAYPTAALSTIRKNVRNIQPQIALQLNYSNPLAVGVVDFWYPGVNQLAQGSGVAPFVTSVGGIGAQTNGSTYLYRNSVPGTFTIAECSFTAILIPTSFANASACAAAYGNSGNSNPLFLLGQGSTAGWAAFRTRDSSDVEIQAADSAWANGKLAILTGTRSIKSGLQTLSINGRQIGSTSASTTSGAVFDRFAIGGLLRSGFGSSWPGQTLLVVVHNRALSPNEITRLHANAYQIFMPDQRPIWVPWS